MGAMPESRCNGHTWRRCGRRAAVDVPSACDSRARDAEGAAGGLGNLQDRQMVARLERKRNP